jgi:deoxyribodipyrimidine photolyase-related protein
MQCLRQSLGHVVAHGYAHHIHRLMVMGLFAQLLGVHPYAFHQWHMAMYLDAIDWVSLPNTLGMSQYGDGGIVGTKPYCASGNYIQKMSPFCKSCRYRPDRATGPQACPFTTLYWDFLARHAEKLDGNPRMGFQMSNLRRRLEGAPDEMDEIRRQADRLRAGLARED